VVHVVTWNLEIILLSFYSYIYVYVNLFKIHFFQFIHILSNYLIIIMLNKNKIYFKLSININMHLKW
jgi:hypothetical protein